MASFDVASNPNYQKYWDEIKHMQSTEDWQIARENNPETEKCVSCDEDTGIPVSTPVDNREYYIDGCGQLCKNCYEKIYGK